MRSMGRRPSARIEILAVDAKPPENRAKGPCGNVSGVVGDHGRALDSRIVPDLMTTFGLPLQHAPEGAKFPAELGVGHAGTTSGTRIGVVSGRKSGGSAS